MPKFYLGAEDEDLEEESDDDLEDSDNDFD